MSDAINYIPYHSVKDWKIGGRIVVDGNQGKIRDIAKFQNPLGTGETIASIGVVYDNEPGIVRLVEFDFHQVEYVHEHPSAILTR